MKIKLIVWCLVSLLTILTIGCKNKNESHPKPEKAILTYPEQNSACTSGISVSVTQSSITFKWLPSANATSYELHLKNLQSGDSISHIVNTNQAVLTLLRNTPFSWHVISKSESSPVTAQSDTWKFYNSGSSISHPPFPADIVAPDFGQSIMTNKVNLSWIGSDADHDIVGYDVYLGTTTMPGILKTDVKDQFLNDVIILSSTTYYWKVVTKDMEGNTSESSLYQFRQMN